MSSSAEATKTRKTVASNPLAVVLWVIVGTGLAFGISQTVMTAAGLFTG